VRIRWKRALTVRQYEWAGKITAVDFVMPPRATSAVVTNLLAAPQGSVLKPVNGHVIVPIKPYEILAVRIDYPRSP
jgi:alpha-mannosidase